MREFSATPSAINRIRLLAIGVPLALLISVQAPRAAEKWSWDGAWKGSLGGISTISITIANDKVVSYLFRGAPIKIIYSKIADTKVSFGDPDHYRLTLMKTGERTASAKYHGRLGYSTGIVTKN